ncbi:sensor histidine kinase [Streptomyces resistomycificus]|uniref:histidine kinase n=1 Tax=Streptomyces resistomycificus TaxID=67356 RepID=A0A0L8KU44_9ACTN|nr:histidine kinase [Streptomyces resistomycificus]KOG29385.1 histidine kinase [Streptomyces resistomycificus]KUO01727.1 histidine kinase [Streptomyces resistomycificus]
MKSLSLRGPARVAGVGVLLSAAAVDLASSAGRSTGVRPVAVVLLVGGAAVLWPAVRRPGRLTPQVRCAVPAVVSGLYTLASLRGTDALFGLGELLCLLCLLWIAVRRCPRRWAVVCGVLDGGAVVAMPVRALRDRPDNLLGYMLIGLVLVGLTAGFAASARSMEYRRTVAVSETRRLERLDIAADLHDFVAHHVTGILVQTRMARMTADSRQDELDPVLAGMERAATEALASMRRTVGVLRDTGTEPADQRPVGDLAGIAGLVDRFASPPQKVTLLRDPTVHDDLPPEVQAAAFRVVQEALTNVRRHAGDATQVTVRLRLDPGRLEVAVTDDGRGGGRLPDAAHGGGFGLVGLKERVTALGGALHAGPRGGHGWEVRADFSA